MVLLVLVVALGAVLLGAGSVAAASRHRSDEVERFHRARGITTGWSRDGMTRPLVVDQERAGTDA